MRAIIPFELAPDASDRSRFAVFGRLLRRAGLLVVVDPRYEPHLAAPLLVLRSDELADGGVFFALSADSLRAPAPLDPPDHGRP